VTTDDERASRLDAAHTANPQSHPLGVFAGDAWAGGVSMFYWYETPEALQDTLLSGDHAAESDDEDRAEVANALAPLLNASEPFLPEKSLEGNSAAEPAFSVRWWGTFDDLCGGDHGEAVTVRDAFFEQTDEDYETPDEVPPIQLDQRAAFAEFLMDWGF
jgi:hypothetical protein